MTVSVPDFSKANVLVVGDLMLDRYWHGDSSRLSPEAPVPVVKVADVEDRPGGSGNVAMNLAALGCSVELCAVVGCDEAAEQLRIVLSEQQINCHFYQQPNVQTITKLRVMAKHQQLLRADFEQKMTVDFTELERKLGLTAKIEACDALVISDYGKGGADFSQHCIEVANRFQKPVLVDPKSTDYSLYRGATMITPNTAEFESVVGHCETQDQIVARAEDLLNRFELSSLLVTRGDKGMALLTKDAEPFFLDTNAQEVFDVTGAGDTVIATLAACLAVGFPPVEAVNLANIAAGIVVGKLGSATASSAEIHAQLHASQQASFGVVTEDELLRLVDNAKFADKVVVMTNGCFDVLHAGHVAYLEEAKKLGDYLIVAVNDDASVTGLKGKGRPINPLDARMNVLAGLRSVDWVVHFPEDTPQRLIAAVLPNLLVKGGDYKAKDIAGYQEVTGSGGQVKILSFEPGFSSSNIVKKIQELD